MTDVTAGSPGVGNLWDAIQALNGLEQCAEYAADDLTAAHAATTGENRSGYTRKAMAAVDNLLSTVRAAHTAVANAILAGADDRSV